MNNYIKNKNKEINILSGHNAITNYDNIFDILNKKEELIKELREQNEKIYYHNLTNNNQTKFNNDTFSYEYTYERFNGFIEIPNFANDFYKLKKSIITFNYFTNCGMSAIVSLLTSIVLGNNISIDLLYDETYFETIKYLTMISKKKYSSKFLYIDSIASNFDFNIDSCDLSNYNGVIIDTTCFKAYEFKKMIEKISSKNLLCILVRSHTKLDLLSTEYSHLGSVSFIYPKNISDNKKELFEKIKLDCRHLIGVYGACVPPNRFPEFMLNNDIKKINEIRLNNVKNNNETLYEYLKNRNIDVVLPNHRQFCLIYLGNIDYELNDMKNKIIDFCNGFKNEFPVYHAVSFGFDYIAIDCYQNFMDNTYKIRICMSDYPAEINKIFYRKIIQFLSNL